MPTPPDNPRETHDRHPLLDYTPKLRTTPAPLGDLWVLLLVGVMVGGIPALFIAEALESGPRESPALGFLIWGLLAALVVLAGLFHQLHVWTRRVYQDHEAQLEENRRLREEIARIELRVSLTSDRLRGLER